jgi:tRNA nucleotidyltransferase (CCA-adding enzyme)
MSVLLKYVEGVLTPTETQTKFLKSKIRSIRKILTNNASLAPREVHTSGSLEKGTMLRHHLDGDVICIYNNEAEIGKNWRKLMLAVHKDLQANFPNIEVEEAGNLAIHVKTELEKQEANIDVVPCYYVNSPKVMNDHTHSKLYAGITTIIAWKILSIPLTDTH